MSVSSNYILQLSHHIFLSESTNPSPKLLALLESHLPYSLLVFRCFQFAAKRQQKAQSNELCGGRILFARYCFPDGGTYSEDSVYNHSGPFAAAYVDLSRKPESQCIVYCTLEDRHGVCLTLDEHEEPELEESEEAQREVNLVLALFHRIKEIALSVNYRGWGNAKGSRDSLIQVGPLHVATAMALRSRDVMLDYVENVEKETRIVGGLGVWERWAIQVKDLSSIPIEIPLPEGMKWDNVQEEDMELVLSKIVRRRKKDILLTLPSMGVRLAEGRLIAWAFVSIDGDIIGCYVEEQYRRLGLAKAVCCKLAYEYLKNNAKDGWMSACIGMMNHASKALANSTEARVVWNVTWAMVHLDKLGSGSIISRL